jgi:hypothetical protein
MNYKQTLTLILLAFSISVSGQDFGNIYENVTYTGKVGNSDVVLTMKYAGNVLQGEYYYTKYSKVINFMSKKSYADESESVIMYEYIDNGSSYDDVLVAMKKSTGHFIFLLKDLDSFYEGSNKLTGKWVSTTTGETFIVNLSSQRNNQDKNPITYDYQSVIPVGYQLKDSDSFNSYTFEDDFDKDGNLDLAIIYTDKDLTNDILAIYLSSNFIKDKSFQYCDWQHMTNDFEFKDNSLTITSVDMSRYIFSLRLVYNSSLKKMKIAEYFEDGILRSSEFKLHDYK